MTYKIKELWQGDIFTYGGADWALLTHEPNLGGRAISTELFGQKPFDEGESKDWREASLKEYMTGDLLKQIIDGGAADEAIIEAPVSLKAINGAEDYGSDSVKIAPLTDAQYDEYKVAIPTVAETYWLVTPFSTEESYIGGAYMHHVRIIRPDGSKDESAPDGALYGVRPSIVIAPETEVEIKESKIDKEIEAIFAYEGAIIQTETGMELAPGLKTLIRITAAECGNIPAVQELKPTEAETYSSETDVAMYQTIRNAAAMGIIARTDITVLADKL